MTDTQNLLAGMVRPLIWSEVDDYAPIKAWSGRQAFCRFVIRRIITPDGVAYRNGRDVGFASLELAQKDASDYYMSLVTPALNPDTMLALQDPVAVHANMLRGTIAKPSWANILHLYPTESLALVAAAYADALKSIADLPTPMTEDQARGHEDAYRAIEGRTPTDATAALERVKADARAEGLEMAAKKATSFLVGDPKNDIPLRSPGPHEIADAIRAMKGEGA